MAVCPICGCKTEELDFVERKIVEADCKVCSFCNRQLKVFDGDAQPTEAQLRWLVAVLEKEVSERDESVFSALKTIYSRFAGNNVQEIAATTPRPEKVPQGNSAKKLKTEDVSADVISDLQKRIIALENEIRTMKRKQMIKTIVELGAPFVLLLLLVIVVLSSGIIDNFKEIFDMAGVAL